MAVHASQADSMEFQDGYTMLLYHGRTDSFAEYF